jgi:hypothetical protein
MFARHETEFIKMESPGKLIFYFVLELLTRIVENYNVYFNGRMIFM